ncbi:MAG: SPOR domain-containing protein [Gammaproteobacteria bacterium]
MILFRAAVVSCVLAAAGCAGLPDKAEKPPAAKSQTPDNQERLRNLQKRASGGDPAAQFQLGLIHENGLGVPRNQMIALSWYRKAALQNQVQAQFRIGLLQYQGGNIAKAIYWWRRAAAAGHSGAQFQLGLRFLKGEGVPRNAAKAAYWFQEAARRGHRPAREYYKRLKAQSQGQVRGAKWILLQDPHYYSLLFFSAPTLQQAHAFIAEYGLRGNTAIYQARDDGQFKVIAGSYETVADAKAVLSRLPPGLARKNPRIVIFSTIHFQIK